MRRCPSVSLVSSSMIEMSASSATARPAPTATPLMALMIGVSHSIIVRTMSPASRITLIVRS